MQEVRVRFSLRPPKNIMNLDNFNSLIELFFYQSEKQDPKSIFLQWLNPNNKKNFYMGRNKNKYI